MSNKKPLSIRISEWDNGPSNDQQKINTINEVKKAFKADKDYSKLVQKNQIQFNIRGSITKNDETTLSNDIDIQIVFPSSYNIIATKDKCQTVLENYFGKKMVQRTNIAIKLKENINRIKADLIICVQDDKSVIAYNDMLQEKIKFYPVQDQKKVASLDELNNGKFTKMVRAYKSCRDEFIKATNRNTYVVSFTIECLLANCKSKTFRKQYRDDPNEDSLERFKAIYASVNEKLKDYDNSKELKELNGIKVMYPNKDYYDLVKKFFKDMKKYIKKTYNMGE